MQTTLKKTLLYLFCFGMIGVVPVHSAGEEFLCEVLSIQGKVTATDKNGQVRVLKAGDLVSSGDIVEAGSSGFADLAFDKEWKNVTRLESGSKMKVGSVYPTRLELSEGGVFAKLKELPKDSSFEVKTPTAVAAARGTEYRTTFLGGRTQIYNVSPSKVYVYGMGADGSVDRKQELVLDDSKKIQVAEPGKPLEAPKDIPADEQRTASKIREGIEGHVEEAVGSGRVSNIQSVSDLEAATAEMKKTGQWLDPNDTNESRVVDARRREFKKAG